MEGEINNLFKVWILVLASLSYCYVVGKTVSKGTKRLIFVIPIVCLFLMLPLKLTSVNLGVTTSFFITWLANFKLLLFAYGKGPLALDPSLSFGRFLVISCLPIDIRENPSHKSPKQKRQKKWHLRFTIKLLVLAILISVFNCKEHLHPKVLLVLYWPLVYILVETILAVVAAMAGAMVGLELEPHFNEPYLSTSLQDFWVNRWNLTVSRIMRLALYEPTLSLWAPLVGLKWAQIPAVVGSFLVVGLVHELFYYYVCRVPPTWEVTWFFVLHGTVLTAEIGLKKAFIIRCNFDARLMQEYAALGEFLRNVSQRLLFFTN
ncbi:probable long-chain-alcohol O-fatty-acyltransferase 1 [Morus notabilis]|uniref:probable long-chain-alcohol O-fatty-acyltransferase 1 n=1 Tax=Morus notabilis TaxID=981085 RepID=UPI000CED3207|nr:probable long-chain-alcohol O-fatty-acyltransferase 1 [Morus notabilis]